MNISLANSLRAICVLVAGSVFSATAIADQKWNQGWQSRDWGNQHIIVFSDCNFTGKNKSIPLGEYRRVREIGVERDAISSMIIPEGLAVEVFQRRGFGGYWYRLNQSQKCLRGNWNDSIRSFRVVKDNPRNSIGFQDDYQGESGQNACREFTLSATRSRGAVRFVGMERGTTHVPAGETVRGELCDNSISKIELAKRNRDGDLLFTIDGQEYFFAPREGYDDFREGWYRQYSSIPTQPNSDNRVAGRDNRRWGNTWGFGQRYSSGVESGENWGNNYPRKWNQRKKPPVANVDNKPENCVAYSVSGNHRDTGIRFLVGDHKFHSVGNTSLNKQLCHTGRIRVELAKRKEQAEVVLTIDGQAYPFKRGDKGDRYEKTWYRKYYSLDIK